MPQLIVTARELKYAGKPLPKGSIFEASDKDAKILKAIKKAEDAPQRKPVRKAAFARPPEAVEPVEDVPAPPEPEASPIEPFTTEDGLTPSPGRYRTRRMKAED